MYCHLFSSGGKTLFFRDFGPIITNKLIIKAINKTIKKLSIDLLKLCSTNNAIKNNNCNKECTIGIFIYSLLS